VTDPFSILPLQSLRVQISHIVRYMLACTSKDGQKFWKLMNTRFHIFQHLHLYSVKVNARKLYPASLAFALFARLRLAELNSIKQRSSHVRGYWDDSCWDARNEKRGSQPAEQWRLVEASNLRHAHVASQH
jgi:hypothetical protein